MKKLLAIALCVAMLLATGVVFASAVDGAWVTSEDEFRAVGELKINWDPDAAAKIKFDGDMSEWAQNEYNVYEIGPDNMVSWAFGNDNMPQNWGIKAYFVADPNGLYIGFFITDDKACSGNNPAGYNGDAFQIGLDFGYIVGTILETDPDLLSNPKDVFYSFCLQPDGEGAEEFQIMRQESDNDGLIGEEDEVKGCTKKTETGWCAEFFMSWDRMYQDADWKAYVEGGMKAAIGASSPLRMGCSLYYLNRDEDNGGPTWAAGTTKGALTDSGAPSVTWTSADDGVVLVLDYVPGMTFKTEGIVIRAEDDTSVGVVTVEVETKPETEPVTKAPEAATDPVTEPVTEAASETVTEAATEAAESGCASVIGGVAIVLAAMAAAVALKKD